MNEIIMKPFICVIVCSYAFMTEFCISSLLKCNSFEHAHQKVISIKVKSILIIYMRYSYCSSNPSDKMRHILRRVPLEQPFPLLCLQFFQFIESMCVCAAVETKIALKREMNSSLNNFFLFFLFFSMLHSEQSQV